MQQDTVDKKTPINARLRADLIAEIDGLCEVFFSNRTSLLEEMLILGLEQFKKANPELVEAVQKIESRKQKTKLILKKGGKEEKEKKDVS